MLVRAANRTFLICRRRTFLICFDTTFQLEAIKNVLVILGGDPKTLESLQKLLNARESTGYYGSDEDDYKLVYDNLYSDGSGFHNAIGAISKRINEKWAKERTLFAPGDVGNLASGPIQDARLSLEYALKGAAYPDLNKPPDENSRILLGKAEELQRLIALKTGPGFSLEHKDNTPLEDEILKGMAMAAAVKEVLGVQDPVESDVKIYSDSPSDAATIEHRKIVQSIYWWQAAKEEASVFDKQDQDAMKNVRSDSSEARQTTVCIRAKNQCFYWDRYTPKSYKTPYNTVARLQALYEAYIRERQSQFAKISVALWQQRVDPQMPLNLKLPLSVIMKHYADNGAESVEKKFKKIREIKPSMNPSFIYNYFVTPSQQGWKLHVSSTPEKSLLVATLVLPIIESFGLDYKVMNYPTQMEVFQDYKNTQQGKVITIYTPYKMHPNVIDGDEKNKEITVALIKALDEALLKAKEDKLLEDKDIIKPPTEMSIGMSGFLSMRYASYTGYSVYDYSSINLESIVDDRNDPFPLFMSQFYETVFPWEFKLRNPVR